MTPEPIVPQPPRRPRRYLPLVIVAGLVTGGLWVTRPVPAPTARPIIDFDAQAAAHHYRKNAVHDLDGFLVAFDRNRDGRIDAAERSPSMHDDISTILDPSQALEALDHLTADVARAEIEARWPGALRAIVVAADPRDAYWRLDTQAQYLARRHGLIPTAALERIDDGGQRRLHGAEDLPPVMPFSDERVRAYPVPWPPGNVAVAEVGGRTRAFLTPFPDGNFGEVQVYELDLRSGALAPYPPARPDLQRALRCSLGIEAHDGVLYVVDHGGYGIRSALLVAIDLASDRVVLEHRFPIALGQMPNDFAFVDDGALTRVFISDTAPGRTPSGSFNAHSGIFELDVERKGEHLEVVESHRHLDGDPLVEDGGFALYPDRDHPARSWLGKLAWGGIDGIAAYDGQVYFRRMQMPEIQVGPARDLRPASIHVLDRFPIIDGFHIDDGGVLWFGDVEGGSLFAYDLRTRAMVKVLQDHRFHWLDEVNVLHDKAYVTASHLHEYMWAVLPWQRKRAVAAAAPYFFYVVDLAPARRTLEQLRTELAQ
jgi:hypothetical protein